MNKIPTAEEFVQTHPIYFPSYTTGAYEGLIEFAKLHVQAALKAAAEQYRSDELLESDNPDYLEQSILNAYPLNNIK